MRRGGAATARARRLWAERDGAASLEFALLGGTFLVLLSFIVGLGLALWAKGAMQAAASQTARCLAVQSPLCAPPQGHISYATDVVRAWGAAGITGPLGVSPPAVTSCGNATGRFSTVTVTAEQSPVRSLIPTFSGLVLSATACYPSAT